MTDYEKLIKEARTLEGMYYKGTKIVQGQVCKLDDEYSIVMHDIHDNSILDTEWSDDVEDILNTLEGFKKQCYKPLNKVVTLHPFHEEYNRSSHHIYSCQFLSSISEVEVIEVDSGTVTPIEEIHEEIRRILNQKKQA